ncbi:hypothetical protein B0H11DRAFT_2213433 [Mycena galericulata]|nr:hypothetical protein B0H11DRAFT_2213433 [Mycena galericulata]
MSVRVALFYSTRPPETFNPGPLLSGLICTHLNTYLYGLVSSQYLNYWNLKFNDPTWIKVVVGMLFLMDTGHSIIAIYEAWNVFVTHLGTPMFADWTRPFTGIATAFSALVTQAFLSHRVFKLTKNKPLTATLAVSIIAAFGFGFTSGIKGYLVNGSFIGVLIFVLSRSKTGFRRTDKIINSLIRGAIQSGLLVTMFTLGDLLAFTLSLKTNLAAFIFQLDWLTTPVKTLLYTLNARMSFFQMDQNDTGGMVTGLSNSAQVQTEFPGSSERCPQSGRETGDADIVVVPLQNKMAILQPTILPITYSQHTVISSRPTYV